MHLSLGLWSIVILPARVILASPLFDPTVQLDQATVTGTTFGNVARFYGIPFAQPPVGKLRLNIPQPIQPYNSSFSALTMGPACPQQALVGLSDLPPVAQDALNTVLNVTSIAIQDDEDCLTINVIKPSNAMPSSKLPVLVWIYGGGFQIGGTAFYDGTAIVERSIELGEPVLYVSMNYRLSAFGFLASQEVKDAGVGNLGLQDQREALRWIQTYIGAFGGDPKKVTIWGESAGAISVGLQMLVNGGDTEGLFRAGSMHSGSPVPVGDITNGQPYYDQIVEMTGCSGSSDTLECLRTVPYAELKAAADATPSFLSYHSLNLIWVPRADGKFLVDQPQKLIQQGKIANIPIVSGDCDDEGTVFSLFTLNVTTEAQFEEWILSEFLPDISTSDLARVTSAYPADITQGSPFDTGGLNAITPQFKRFAAFQGDTFFQAPRRFFLQYLSGRQNIWSFLSKRNKALPVLGSAHTTDLLYVYGGEDMSDYLIRFTATLNPNGNTGITWPQYTTENPNLLTFLDGLVPLTVAQDTYRKDAMQVMIDVLLNRPVGW